MRNPKAGRAWESYRLSALSVRFIQSPAHLSFGPDPYLTGEAAYHTVHGVQSTGVQASIKHFVANNQEHWRYGLTANVDERTLREVYAYPFERGIEVTSPLY